MASRKETGTLTIDCGVLGELEVDWVANYWPGTPDKLYLPNGDPGYPGDPAELEVLSAKNGRLDLTPALEDNELFHEMVLEQINQGD